MTFILEILGGDLKRALEIATQVTDTGTKIPILKTTRIECEPDSATFIATNLDHSIRVSVPASGSGSVNLDTQTLAAKANVIDAKKPVMFAGDDKFVSITQGRSRWKMPIITGDNFPVDLVGPIADPVEIDARKFFMGIRAAQTVIDPGAIGIIVAHGALLDMRDGFRVVGAASKGLSVERIGDTVIQNDCILPNRSMQAAAAIFKDSATIMMAATENAISISDGDIFYRSKLIEGKFLDWRRSALRADKNTSTVTVDVPEMLLAIEASSAIREDIQKSGRWVVARLEFEGGTCSVIASNRDGEEGRNEFSYDGDNGSIVVNAEVFSACVRSIEGASQVTMTFQAGSQEPIKIVAYDGGDGMRLAMPMRG